MKRWIAVAGAALWLAASGASAQSITQPTPRALELAARYIELMDLEAMFRQQYLEQNTYSDEMMTGMEGLGIPMKGDAPSEMPNFVPETDFSAMEPMIGLMESVMTQAMAETYPESELETIVEFYDTEEGRRILGRQAALQSRMNGIMLERMPEMFEAMGMDPSALTAGMYGGGSTSTAPTRSMAPSEPFYSSGSIRDQVQNSADVEELIQVITAEAY